MDKVRQKLPLCIIMSGAYAAPDIIGEYGKLPPAFLPVGTHPLYRRQIEFANHIANRVIFTIPADFRLPALDVEWLEKSGTQVVRSPNGIALGLALQFLLEAINLNDAFALLHGDTLVELPDNLQLNDIVLSSETDAVYSWADIHPEGSSLRLATSLEGGAAERSIACGFFAFSNTTLLRTCLQTSSDFVTAVDLYGQQQPLHSHPARKWYDFGGLSRMLQSRRDLLVGRSFNNLSCDGAVVTKRSSQAAKMRAEAEWYKAIPPLVKRHTPQFLGELEKPQSGYQIEYIYQPTLAELFVYGKLPTYLWRQILHGCVEFLSACGQFRPETDSQGLAKQIWEQLVQKKSEERLAKFISQHELSWSSRMSLNGALCPPLEGILQELIEMIAPTSVDDVRLMHGDPFFGNMFFDFRARRVRAIDPRGEISSGEPMLWGDWRYDLAKLAHSIHGRYDHILAERIPLCGGSMKSIEFVRPNGPQLDEICSAFGQMSLNGRSCLDREILALEALLFFSMLPLHADSPERQRALLANGLLLHRELTQ